MKRKLKETHEYQAGYRNGFIDATRDVRNHCKTMHRNFSRLSRLIVGVKK